MKEVENAPTMSGNRCKNRDIPYVGRCLRTAGTIIDKEWGESCIRSMAHSLTK